MTHLPSTMTVTDRPPTPKPSSSVAADDLPYLFALLRSRSTNGRILEKSRPIQG
jgi:hypothetical protein